MLLARGRTRYRAPNGAWLGAFEATEHGERKGQGSGVDGLTVARRRRARRRCTSVFMANDDREREGDHGVVLANWELTVNPTEAVAKSEELGVGRN